MDLLPRPGKRVPRPEFVVVENRAGPAVEIGSHELRISRLRVPGMYSVASQTELPAEDILREEQVGRRKISVDPAPQGRIVPGTNTQFGANITVAEDVQGRLERIEAVSSIEKIRQSVRRPFSAVPSQRFPANIDQRIQSAAHLQTTRTVIPSGVDRCI